MVVDNFYTKKVKKKNKKDRIKHSSKNLKNENNNSKVTY